MQTNILFLENVLRHPEFLSGQATTSFIDRHPQLFNFNSRGSPQSSLVLSYLADLVRCRAGCVHFGMLSGARAVRVCDELLAQAPSVLVAFSRLRLVCSSLREG